MPIQLKHKEDVDYSSFYRVVMSDGTEICTLQYWLLDCCAVAGLCDFSYANAKYLDEFLNYLKDSPLHAKLHYTPYKPKEFLFILGSFGGGAGTGPFTQALAKVAKKIDSWPNRAHSSSGVDLYRLSLE